MYDFFLSKETFHTYDRWYLLGVPMLSFLLRMIQISSFKEGVSESLMLSLSELLISPETIVAQSSYYSGPSMHYIDLIFYGGVVVVGLLFLGKLIKILTLVSTNQVIKTTGSFIGAFSQSNPYIFFFSLCFLRNRIDKREKRSYYQT